MQSIPIKVLFNYRRTIYEGETFRRMYSADFCEIAQKNN